MFGIFKNMFAPTDNSALKEALQNGAFIVDVRSPMEFYAGSAKGAVNIPVETIGDQLNQFKNKKSIVVFCRSGARSAQAKRILEQNGYTNVIDGSGIDNVLSVMNE